MKKLFYGALIVLALAVSACTVDDTYASCFDGADCADPADRCLEVRIDAEGTCGAFCTADGCASHASCESSGFFDGVCYSLDGSASLCYQQCDFDSDCWSRNVCIPVDLGGGLTDFICVPNNGC